jgi:hypothetical protein
VHGRIELRVLLAVDVDLEVAVADERRRPGREVGLDAREEVDDALAVAEGREQSVEKVPSRGKARFAGARNAPERQRRRPPGR